MILEKGNKVKFFGEDGYYVVRTANLSFAVCTKPFNLKKTVIYTAVDYKNNIRGTENLIFCAGAESDEECEEMLQRLTFGETEISGRNWTNLNIEKVK